MILSALGWIAALTATAATGYRAWFMRDALSDIGNWVVLLAWSALTVVTFTILGVIGLPAGALLTGAAAVIIVVAGRVWTPEGRRALAGDLREGLTEPFSALRGLTGRSRGKPEATETQETVAEAVATRGIPSVMDDATLGPAPEPASLASPSVPVPAPWAALAEYIRSREPEDDMELRILAEGDAAGALAVADARHAFADTCLNTIGLDPAYVAGVLETGDSMAEHASMLAQVHKRFGVIYGAVQEWVATHGPLPHKAREWLTGDS